MSPLGHHPLIEINAQNMQGDTALIAACRQRRADCVLALLCHDPEPRTDLRNRAGQTAAATVSASQQHADKAERFDPACETIRGLLANLTQLRAAAWTPDSAAAECQQCARAFGSLPLLGPRRHHCRACGRVLCSACASYLGVVAGVGDGRQPVRICRACAVSADVDGASGAAGGAGSRRAVEAWECVVS